MRKLRIFLFSAVLFAAPHAMAAKFTAQGEEGKVTVYSTTTKAEKCKVMATFTYLEKNKREEGWTSCGEIVTKPGKDMLVCTFEDERVVAPLITGVVVEGCSN